MRHPLYCSFFFFNDTATTEIYTLSLHDALPIFNGIFSDLAGLTHISPFWRIFQYERLSFDKPSETKRQDRERFKKERSEEHTSELQSQSNLVCRLLLEKKTQPIYHVE